MNFLNHFPARLSVNMNMDLPKQTYGVLGLLSWSSQVSEPPQSSSIEQVPMQQQKELQR